MSKRKEKSMAIELRLQGYTYGEIIEALSEEGIKVSKGSLSNWLKDVQLDENSYRILENSVAEKKSNSLKKAREVKSAISNSSKTVLSTGGFLCE